MIRAAQQFDLKSDISSRRPLVVGGCLMATTVVLASLFFAGFEGTMGAMERPYLAPWVIATGITLVLPLVYLYRRNEFSFLHPLVLITVTYLFPIFFVGGWSLVFGWSNYYYLTYVDDPEWNFQLTYAYIIIASVGFSLGMLMPLGKRVGVRFGQFLPAWDFKTGELVVLGTVSVALGVFLLVTAIDAGTTGFQGMEHDSLREVGNFGAFLGMILPVSGVFLWVAFFRIERWSFPRFALLAFLIGVGVFTAISAGSKAGLMNGFVGILVAFTIARRKLNAAQWTFVGLLSVVILFVGFTYANEFRKNKGLGRTSAEVYYQVAVDSISSIGSGDLTSQIGEFVPAFLERIEIASSFAVVVSNHELLARYEQAYGLENNIWQSTWMGFIPRFVWNDKPVVGDNRAFNQLYLDTEWSGFSITAMGDLLRNFGPLGIPIGMLLLGFLLRTLYAALIEGGNFESWKGVLFYAVITQVNLEGFYGHIVPASMRVAAVVILLIVAMRVVVLLFRGLGSKSL